MPVNEIWRASIRSTRAAVRSCLPRFARWRGALVLSSAILLDASAADAGRVVQVRVGQHDSFTRVVIELDGATPHRVVRSLRTDVGPELLVRIDADSEPRRITSKSRFVDAVTLSRDGDATVAQISLRAADLRVEEKRFTNPERIVLDLHAVANGEEPPANRGELSAEAANATPPPPGSGDSAVVFSNAAAEAAAVAAPAELDAEIEADAALEADGARDSAPVVEVAQSEIEQPPSAPAAASSELAAEPVPAAAPAPNDPQPIAVPPAPPPAPPLAEAPSVADAAAAESPNVSGPPATLLPGGMDLRVLVGGAVVLLSAFLLWGVLGRRDRTAQEVVAALDSDANAFADRPAASPWEGDPHPSTAIAAEPQQTPEGQHTPEDDTPAVHGVSATSGAESDSPCIVVRGEPIASEHALWVDPDQAAPPTAPLIADAEQDDRPAPRLTLVPSPAGGADAPGEIESDTSSAHAEVVATGDVISEPVDATLERVRTLEQRIATLERRLEDAADSRERIERQVVAQTEELRVQRAAIARTQRVLRSIAKPEELAMEPVPPRGPSGATG